MKTILITGASRGIGAETARHFARAGWQVGINYHRSEEQALALVRELEQEGCSVLPLQADVSDFHAVSHIVDKMLDRFNHIDVLLCNAGISHSGLFTDVQAADWRHLFAVNVDGTYHAIQSVLPHMIHRKHGSIITMSSIWGITGASCEVAYSATKGAIIAMTKALAKELGPSGITVNCIAPGVIDTEMNGNLSPEDLLVLAEETPLGRIGTASDIAKAVAFLASDGGQFITGQVLSPNGGLVI